MDIDPHTLQQILVRIEKQLRCPQCGKAVPVDFAAVQVMAESAMLLQLKCEHCSAFIVLHASLQGLDNLTEQCAPDETKNTSTTMQVSEKELQTLQAALEQSDGSFSALFEQAGIEPTND